ncbi:trypsin-like peptidase domain-containing protein [Pseudohalioglobus sediminis]|uniref:Trypsin-like peptidase domain-containing protein n=1 Tax=Pseudohalioglobus sediminis TaxID=2606449 RepID=A0A5B0X772_9GAMM|nr:trypsin-like peptidase domain-containing protein [Pseudohalioglobus sediminis]KAA1194201.1 trypsin-like peptidase domain-containing protein [Pseudohalioglobus sediminis]
MRRGAILLAAVCTLVGLLSARSTWAEPRQAYHGDAPQWLRAVGKLHVPGVTYRDGYSRHQQENCSGTLVSSAGSDRADTVITAWHCLEFYRDLSRPITFTLLLADGERIAREAHRLADGGGMYADWAVLRLQRAVDVADVPALIPHPARADPARAVTMAGYSGDPGLGRHGEALTFHAGCRITRQQRGESESDCSAYKGASGGAVVQVSATGEAYFSGVISRGDGERVSLFVPVSGFRGPLNRFLN